MFSFRPFFGYILIFFSILHSTSTCTEIYDEQLNIVPLDNGYVSATFKFQVRRRGADLDDHYDLFPKAIGEIVRKYLVDEFHLTLSHNFWRWTYQPSPATPTGAQLWAWFNRNQSVDVDTQWRDLVHALSGLFCASFSQIDNRRLTIEPKYEFRPRGVREGSSMDNRFLRYAILPGDNVCTENVTPWKKLLPCKSLAGIGALLAISTRLFSSDYLSLGVDVRRVCTSEMKCTEDNVEWELVQTLNVVFDTMRNGAVDEWSLKSLFGTQINTHCNVARSSLIFVDVDKHTPQLSPAGSKVVMADRNRRYAVFDVNSTLSEHALLNVGASYKLVSPYVVTQRPTIHMHNYIGGSGLQSGHLISRLFNRLDVHVPILYSHTIPWFLRVYYHTLKIRCARTILKPKFVSYQPARDRKRAHYFEIALDLPPTNSSESCELSIKFDRQLLRYAEYPPDAHRGFPIPAPMISFYNPWISNHTLLHSPDTWIGSLRDASNSNEKTILESAFTIVYGESLLVNLPTPDFSMPYNVICLVCTVVALAFGPIHGLTTKSLTIADRSKVKKHKLLQKLDRVFSPILEKIRGKFKRDNSDFILKRFVGRIFGRNKELESKKKD